MINNCKDKRFQLRLTDETYFRIKALAQYRKTSMAAVIEKLVDDVWVDLYSLFRTKNKCD